MSSKIEAAGARECWFVGAYGTRGDQTPRFLEEGIWENGYKDKYQDEVRSIQIGDRIAIKSSYTRKHELPFDNRAQTVSVMAIKAIGTVTENLGDGRKLKVAWKPLTSPREWYFFTHRGTIWRVVPGKWETNALIGFAFENEPQDLNRFRNAPFWRERFGDGAVDKRKFLWTRFYEAIADKLLTFKNNRAALIAGIHDIAARVDGLSNLQEQLKDGTTAPLKDICPFTAMGIFNRNITETNRKIIAAELAKFIGVEETVPEVFEGIPYINNQRSWFFRNETKRLPDDIDTLWTVFEQAIRFAESDDPEVRATFIKAYDKTVQQSGVGWNLSMGLYWIRPWIYPTLDRQSKLFIQNKLGIKIGLNGPKKRCNANDYLTVMETLETRFQDEACPVHSFPELSLAAYHHEDGTGDETGDDSDEDDGEGDQGNGTQTGEGASYTKADALSELFMSSERFDSILGALNRKKNIVLQGPPGVGKTYAARRLAYSLIGKSDPAKVETVQFHPSYSYEDFIQGYRPTKEGHFQRQDGVFFRFCMRAKNDPSSNYVFIIDEINRGNVAKILGELMMLVEPDKRGQDHSISLAYSENDKERFFLPKNLYLTCAELF